MAAVKIPINQSTMSTDPIIEEAFQRLYTSALEGQETLRSAVENTPTYVDTSTDERTEENPTDSTYSAPSSVRSLKEWLTRTEQRSATFGATPQSRRHPEPPRTPPRLREPLSSDSSPQFRPRRVCRRLEYSTDEASAGEDVKRVRRARGMSLTDPLLWDTARSVIDEVARNVTIRPRWTTPGQRPRQHKTHPGHQRKRSRPIRHIK